MRKYLIILLFSLSILFAGTIENVFEDGIEAYQKQDFETALIKFKSIENEEVKNADLFYNIGNCYYRLGKISDSIYYMKKALKINPVHKSALRELKFLLSQTKDKQEIEEKNKMLSLIKSIDRFFTFNVLALVTLLFFSIGTIIISFTFLKASRDKTVPYFFSILSFAFFFIFLQYAFFKNYKQNSINEAVIFSKTVAGFSGPSDDFTRVFTIHEGMIIKIIQVDNDWAQVQLFNGIGGWIPRQTYKKI